MRALVTILLLASLPAGADVLRDPTAPPRDASRASSSDAQHAEPRLTTVLIASDRRVAVIDGHALAEGEARDGLKLVSVRADGATVTVNGAARELHLEGAHMIKERSPP